MHCPKCKAAMEYDNGAFVCDVCDIVEYPYSALIADEEEAYVTDVALLHLV